VVTVKLADNGRLDVSAGKSHFRLATLPAQDFPVTPALEQPRVLTMDAAALRSVIDRTLFSVAGDDNRYGLNGAHVEDTSAGAGPVVRFVSTDGNRLSWAQAPYTGELAIGRKMLLPRKGLDQFRRLLDGAEGLVELGFGERAALARWEGISLHLRLLEADFPDYRQVLPTSFRRKAIADREALASALRRVAILATDQSNSVKFQFLAESVQLSARKLDAGDSEEELPIDFSGDSVALGFNARFVLEVLSAMHGERVIIELGDALHPCVLRDPGDDSALFVVMPVRLD
jgi:DNA polymerase-3 subunit beta